MAIAAARGAINARNQRKKLLERTKSMTETSLDKRQRASIVESLRENENTLFLVNLTEGGQSPDQEEEVEIVDDPVVPPVRPPFLSERHFAFLGRYFIDENVYQPSWMDQYHKGGTEVAKDDEDGAAVRYEGEEANAWVKGYNEFILLNQVLAVDVTFNLLVTAAILVAGILVGIQMYPRFMDNPALSALDLTVQCIFTADCAFKIFREGPSFWNYWVGPDLEWNNFDFWLVAICWIPAAVLGGNVNFLRLLRLMRLLKLVKKIKQLQVLVKGLMKGLGSVVYIVILLLLVWYLYAIVGVTCFRKNDPFHFGGLGIAMLTLYLRIATFESWTAVMYINYFGCDGENNSMSGWYYSAGGGPAAPTFAVNPQADSSSIYPDKHHQSIAQYPGLKIPKGEKIYTPYGSFNFRICWHPKAQPVITAIYFTTFPLLGGFIVFSFFIGAIVGGMSDAYEEFYEEQEQQEKVAEAKMQEVIDPNGALLLSLRDFFDMIDEDNSGEIVAAELMAALVDMGEADITEESARAMIEKVDANKSGTLGFDEFVMVMTNGDLDVHKLEHADKVAEEFLTPKALAHKYKVKEEKEAALAALKERTAIDLRRAWGLDDQDKLDAAAAAKLRPIRHAFLQASGACKALADTLAFQGFMNATIMAAGFQVGAEVELSTRHGSPAHTHIPAWLTPLNNTILIIFTIEVLVKMLSHGLTPLKYFNDNWNKFDFVIVFLCDLFWFPALPSLGSVLTMLRLFRLMRMVRVIPQLRVIVEALVNGLSQIFFTLVILFVFFYIYAIIGIFMFASNDYARFGNLQMALLTLWRQATFDSWSDPVYTNMFGCNWWVYSYGRVSSNTKYMIFPQPPESQGAAQWPATHGGAAYPNMATRGVNYPIVERKRDHARCNKPKAWGWLAALYSVVFCIFGSQVLLTLFIGVVATTMEEAKAEYEEEQEKLARMARRAAVLGIDPKGTVIAVYRDIFEQLDVRRTGHLKRDDIKPIITVLPPVHRSYVALTGRELRVGRLLTRLDIDNLFEVLSIKDGLFGNKSRVEFPEFVVVMDFMRRSIFERGVVDILRDAMKVGKTKGSDKSLESTFVSKMSRGGEGDEGGDGGEGWEAVEPKAAPAKKAPEKVPVFGAKEHDWSGSTVNGAPGAIMRIKTGFIDCVYADEAEAKRANGLTDTKLRMLLDTGSLHQSIFRFLRVKPTLDMTASLKGGAHTLKEAKESDADKLARLTQAVAHAAAKRKQLEAKIAKLEEAAARAGKSSLWPF